MDETSEPGPDFDVVTRLQAELEGESARGMVLVSAAMLEEALLELLVAFLVPNALSSDPMFDGPTAPLSSFSAKIDLSYRLGLLSDKFCRDLHVIRRIRNDVAHKPKSFSFEDGGARDRILALSNSHGLFQRSPNWVAKRGPPSLREQFVEAATWMIFYLAAARARMQPLRTRELEFGYLMTMDKPNLR